MLHHKGILDHIADPRGRQHLAGLVIDVSIFADDEDVEVVADAVGVGHGGAVIRDDEGEIGADGAFALAKGGDEDGRAAGEAGVGVAELVELFAEGAGARGFGDEEHHGLATEAARGAAEAASSRVKPSEGWRA